MCRIADCLRVTLDGMEPATQAEAADSTEQVDSEGNLVGNGRWGR